MPENLLYYFLTEKDINAMMRRSTYFLNQQREDGWWKSLFW